MTISKTRSRTLKRLRHMRKVSFRSFPVWVLAQQELLEQQMLSKGRPITEAIVQGVRGAVPGGAAGQAVFDVAYAGVSGKPITEVALAAIPIPADQKKLMMEGTKILKDIASGKRVDQVAFNTIMTRVPSEYKHAFQTGMAIA